MTPLESLIATDARDAPPRAWNPPEGLEGTVQLLRALAHPSRALIFRTLGRAGTGGLSQDELAVALGLRGSTLVAHLKALADVGLIHGSRDADAVRYRAGRDALASVNEFLVPDAPSRPA